MQKSIQDLIRNLTERYPEYAPEAYDFMRAGLEHAANHYCKGKTNVHLTAEQLYLGACSYALEEYGPLALNVLNFWGINSGVDFGRIVYNLIEVGIFGKQKEDKQEEFDVLPNLEEVLNAPYHVEMPEDIFTEYTPHTR